MRHKFIRNIKSKKYYAVTTAVSSGLFTIISLICVCGLCISRFDVPDAVIFAASCFVLGMGGYISGYLYGKKTRHKGIISGLKCGVILWGIVSIYGFAYTHNFSLSVLLRDFLFLTLPSAAGGIYGVNTRIKTPPYR